MKIVECGELLSSRLRYTFITVPEGTPLYRAGGAIAEMARAYSKDGDTFFAGGDLVNALAGYWYGFGWLDFGYAYGLLAAPEEAKSGCPFQGSCELLPGSLAVKLGEKTTRYARLLDTAHASVVPAPDPATSAHDFACRVLLVVECYALQGSRYHASGANEDALSCFSYGHGWLDAAVRAGLFQIVSDRSLFTV